MTFPHPHPLPSLSYLEEMKGLLRVHPNRFIQLDLNETNRLHVWHPNLGPCQKTFHAVHDHIFDLQSTVYKGRLIHVEYELYYPPVYHDNPGTHQRWEAECIGGSETILKKTTDTPCHLVHKETTVIQPYVGYIFPAYKFHEALANEPTMTIMTKYGKAEMHGGANCQGASIMVPVGVTPDNTFRRDSFGADELFALVKEAYPHG